MSRDGDKVATKDLANTPEKGHRQEKEAKEELGEGRGDRSQMSHIAGTKGQMAAPGCICMVTLSALAPTCCWTRQFLCRGSDKTLTCTPLMKQDLFPRQMPLLEGLCASRKRPHLFGILETTNSQCRQIMQFGDPCRASISLMPPKSRCRALPAQNKC